MKCPTSSTIDLPINLVFGLDALFYACAALPCNVSGNAADVRQLMSVAKAGYDCRNASGGMQP
jgi:hypothetical protein